MIIDPSIIPFILVGGGIIFLFIFFHYVPFFLWLSAKVSGVDISLVQLFLMRIRNVPPHIIVPAMIEAHKAGLSNITRACLPVFADCFCIFCHFLSFPLQVNIILIYYYTI